MRGYLLDTSALSAYYNEQHPHHAKALETINELGDEVQLLVSVITIAEIDYGVRLAEFEGSAYLPELRDRADKIRQHAQLPITHHTSAVYAELKAGVAKQMIRPGKKKRPRYIEDWVDRGSGKALQLDENDLWICSQAKERDLTIITTDPDFRSFEKVDPDIRVILAR